MKIGKVWLVGAGPGDIGLFTLKGLKVLEQADVVVYDSLVGQGVLSRIPEGVKLMVHLLTTEGAAASEYLFDEFNSLLGAGKAGALHVLKNLAL